MPLERAERDGVASRDLLLDGRVRSGIPLTLILAPGLGLFAWVPYAPALGDSFRKTYRQLLKWNDELPFVKFALSDDERIVLTAELPMAGLGRDAVGRTVARLLAVCDLLAEPSARWLAGPGRSWTVTSEGSARHHVVMDRYAADIAELTESQGGS